MPPMRAARIVSASACLIAASSLIAGCGGDSNSTDGGSGATESAQSRPAPLKSDFPATYGRTLKELIKDTDNRSELIVTPAALAFYKGENRYPFGVSERDRGQVNDAEVALYYAKVPTPKPGTKSKPGSKGQQGTAEEQALEEPAVGPFPAAIESLATKPAFRAKSTIDDPDAAGVVYAAQLDFPSNGEWRLAAVIKEGDETSATLLPSVSVGEFSNIPRPGQQAPLIHTPTAADVGGDLSKITTRIPADTLNKVDYADALGKEPIVLLFATPQFCQSRVCGPVVDVAEQAKHVYGDKAAFIHMEIYNDNDPARHTRHQVRAFHLPTEPWLFTIDRNGTVSAAVEGAFGVEEMDEAVDKAIAK
jgi:hypothetical protein